MAMSESYSRTSTCSSFDIQMFGLQWSREVTAPFRDVSIISRQLWYKYGQSQNIVGKSKHLPSNWDGRLHHKYQNWAGKTDLKIVLLLWPGGWQSSLVFVSLHNSNHYYCFNHKQFRKRDFRDDALQKRKRKSVILAFTIKPFPRSHFEFAFSFCNNGQQLYWGLSTSGDSKTCNVCHVHLVWRHW